MNFFIVIILVFFVNSLFIFSLIPDSWFFSSPTLIRFWFFSTSISDFFSNIFISIFNSISFYLPCLSNVYLSSSSLYSLFISLKFIFIIAILVFVRGGIPRYRFDYLSKLGWTKFLSLIVLSFLLELYLLWIF